jgi:lactate dehydrogenase-like 2-hydroxyacid dehydrogenase
MTRHPIAHPAQPAPAGSIDAGARARPHLLQVGEFPPELQDEIDREFTVHSFAAATVDAGLAASIVGIITRSNYTITAEMIAAFPNLRIVATSGVGYDGIPLDAARARGITVTNTPGVLDAAVCELALGILLALLRRIPQGDAYTRSGAWSKAAFPLTTSLAGKSVGILGLGRIGQGIAKRLAPFDVRLFYSGSAKPGLPYTRVGSVIELARTVDILFVCCRGGAATEKLVNAAVLEALGPEGFLINMSRGSVVDEAALVEALKHGAIKGAGLDVYNNEPEPDPALLAASNTVLTPHVGSATRETRRLMLRLTLDNLHAVLAGQPALTPVLE